MGLYLVVLLHVLIGNGIYIWLQAVINELRLECDTTLRSFVNDWICSYTHADFVPSIYDVTYDVYIPSEKGIIKNNT